MHTNIFVFVSLSKISNIYTVINYFIFQNMGNYFYCENLHIFTFEDPAFLFATILFCHILNEVMLSNNIMTCYVAVTIYKTGGFSLSIIEQLVNFDIIYLSFS